MTNEKIPASKTSPNSKYLSTMVTFKRLWTSLHESCEVIGNIGKSVLNGYDMMGKLFLYIIDMKV